MENTQADAKFTPYQEQPGEEYMNDAQVEHFRHILLSWRAQLREEVDRTVHHMQDEAANFPDPNDRATQEEEFTLELRTRDRERKLIKKSTSRWSTWKKVITASVNPVVPKSGFVVWKLVRSNTVHRL